MRIIHFFDFYSHRDKKSVSNLLKYSPFNMARPFLIGRKMNYV